MSKNISKTLIAPGAHLTRTTYTVQNPISSAYIFHAELQVSRNVSFIRDGSPARNEILPGRGESRLKGSVIKSFKRNRISSGGRLEDQ